MTTIVRVVIVAALIMWAVWSLFHIVALLVIERRTQNLDQAIDEALRLSERA